MLVMMGMSKSSTGSSASSKMSKNMYVLPEIWPNLMLQSHLCETNAIPNNVVIMHIQQIFVGQLFSRASEFWSALFFSSINVRISYRKWATDSRGSCLSQTFQCLSSDLDKYKIQIFMHHCYCTAWNYVGFTICRLCISHYEKIHLCNKCLHDNPMTSWMCLMSCNKNAMHYLHWKTVKFWLTIRVEWNPSCHINSTTDLILPNHASPNSSPLDNFWIFCLLKYVRCVIWDVLLSS